MSKSKEGSTQQWLPKDVNVSGMWLLLGLWPFIDSLRIHLYAGSSRCLSQCPATLVHICLISSGSQRSVSQIKFSDVILPGHILSYSKRFCIDSIQCLLIFYRHCPCFTIIRKQRNANFWNHPLLKTGAFSSCYVEPSRLLLFWSQFHA